MNSKRLLPVNGYEKSYPPENILKRIYNRLTEDKTPLERLRDELNMGQEEFETAQNLR